MKISVNRDDLLKPLIQVGNVVEKRQTLPILANVLASTQGNTLSITATDLEVELKTAIAVESETDFDITIPARKLMDICKALPDDTNINLEITGEKAILKAGRGRYTLGTLPAKDYPSIEPASVSDKLTITESSFKRLLEKTQFAMAQQDVRYYLNGLLLEITPGRIRTVATDGHRMALCDGEFENPNNIDIQAILPRKAVIELIRLLTDSEDDMQIELSNSHICVHLSNGSKFTSKLIDGRFPDYERVIPTGDASNVVADRGTFKQALSRTAILSNEKYRGIRFKLGSDVLHLQAHNPEQDEAEEEISVEYGGPEMTIGFNVGYLLDVLNVIDSEQVNVSVIDSNSSCLITQYGSNESRYVVMPMRL